MRSALITGHLGFVGRHLSEYLADTLKVETWGYSLTHGQDVRDYESLRLAVERSDPDWVFHLAAQAYVPESTTDPHRAVGVNICGTLNLLEAIRHTGCRARVLIAGTSEEYGYDHPEGTVLTEDSPNRPTTIYGVSKLAAGQAALTYARTYSIPVVVTRTWNHTGPGQTSNYAVPSFARKIVEIEAGKRSVLTHGNLEAVRHYLDVRDVVRAYTEAIQLESGVYNICGPASNTMQMKGILAQLVGRASQQVVTQADAGLYRPGMQTGSSVFPTPNCDKLVNATGWQARFSLPLTLSDTLNYWRERVNGN